MDCYYSGCVNAKLGYLNKNEKSKVLDARKTVLVFLKGVLEAILYKKGIASALKTHEALNAQEMTT